MAKNCIPLTELLPVICEVLATGGEFILQPRGKSMLPYFREGRDTIVLSPVTEAPKRDDILLYVRKSGVPVLHRVVLAEDNGTLTMRGDNQYFLEPGIEREQVLAIVKRYQRHGRERRTDALSSRLYCTRRRLTYPLRRFVHRAIGFIKRNVKRGEKHG